MTSTALAITGFAAVVTAAATTTSVAVAMTPWEVPAGFGATVPFTQYEAESATTNGTLVGPDITQGTVASEASGRTAVQLASQGRFVEFTLTRPANAVTVAYNLPRGASGTLSVYLNGTKASQGLQLTSRFMYLDTPWIMGSRTHHLLTHGRLLLGAQLAAGARVRLQVDAGDVTGAIIDTADFETVAPPAAQPPGSVSVTSTGADPSGAGDSTQGFNQAISRARAQGQSVWIPPGNFRITSPLQIDAVTMRGAGPWHSVLRGTHLIDNGSSAGPIRLHDFAAIGEVTIRNDGSPDNFVNGSLGNGSVVSNIWIQHQKVGLWLVGPNNTNLTIENSRFLDLTADGLNFNGTVTNSVVRNNYLRNTGDDSLAMWSIHSANVGNTFSNNTIVQPNLANGIAIYGGRDTTLSRNVIADTNALGSGIAISNQEFIAGMNFTPLAGTINVTDNVMIRAGAFNPNWQHPMSAIRVDAFNYPITTGVMVNITGGQIVESPFSAIQVVGGDGTGKPVTSLSVSGVVVRDVGTVVMQMETSGSGSFSNVTATGIGVAGIYNCAFPPGSGTFTFNLGPGNAGWPGNVWPSCAFPNPGERPPLTLTPGSLTFGTHNVGTTSPPQQLTVRNPGSAAVTLSSITTSGDFARTTTCGSSLAAGASCTVSVTFTPTAAGSRTGTLTISSSAGTPSTAPLSGTGFDPAGNLAAGRPVTATSHTQTFVPGNAVDGDANSYWESANGAFPQSITVDLGAARSASRIVLKLPPPAAWQARTQTLSVLGSTDGSAFSTVVGSAGYRFDPATGNSVTITFGATSRRYLRLTFTANTGWSAAQLAEFEVYAGGGTPAPALSVSPASLAFGNQPVGSTSQGQAVTISNTGSATATLSGVATSGDYARTTTCGSSLAAGASCAVTVTFTPTAAGVRTGTLTVTSNAPGSPHTGALSGTGVTGNPNLAAGRPVTATSHAQTFAPPNAVDGNASSYWESANNAFPQSITVDLGAARSVSRVVLKLPPPAAWQARTQTLSVLGSTDGSAFSTVVGSAGYRFDPATGNSVTITFGATSRRYLRLTFTANTGWPAAQLSELEVYAS